MTQRKLASATFAAFLFLLGVFTAAARAENTAAATDTAAAAGATAAIQTKVPWFDVKDISGRIVQGDQLKGWIVVYAFGNEDNAETGVDWLKQVAKTNPTADGVLFVIIADASKYPKVMGPFVKKVMKKEYRKEMDRIKAYLDEKNIHPPFNLEDRYLMVADTSGAYFNLFGIGGQKNIPHIFFVDGEHNIRAHFTAGSDEMVGTLSTLIADRESQKQFGLNIKKKKKNVFKRYAVIGALVWFGIELF
jgi:hypothetical protein